MQIDARQLRKRCKMTKSPGKEIAPGLWYIDNGADILGVAHLDYVPQTTHFDYIRILPGNHKIIYSGQLDNRLGVYTLLDVLPLFGCAYDVLRTTDEEKCQSTAWQFVTEKQYKWAFSFDRAGTRDVALYQYLDTDSAQAVKQVGLIAAYGSYSDIVELDDLGCKCFNWCNGLQDGHSITAHVEENDYLQCVLRFADFWEMYSGTHFPHIKEEWETGKGKSGKGKSGQKWQYWGWDDPNRCEWCGEYSEVLQEFAGDWICEECASIDQWLDECALCSKIGTVEYHRPYDCWLCEECAELITKGE